MPLEIFYLTYPPDFPAILIVQHLPASVTSNFAKMLNNLTAMTVKEASDGEVIHRGHIYVSEGAKHLRLEKVGNDYVCRVGGVNLLNGHCPSVDVLFDSVAQNAKSNAIGVLLTGMGNDGAKGLKNMRESGIWTIAQDKESSVVWGMPGAAVAMGAAQRQLHVHEIGPALLRLTY